jgi:hypothetical protein
MSEWDGTKWVEPARTATRRESAAARWIATALIVGGALLAVVPLGAVSAARAGSSVWIESSAGARLAASAVHYGDGFMVGYSTTERQPWAHVRCFANGTTTYQSTYADGSIWGMYFSVYPGGPQPQDFVAGQSVDGNWSGGGADCRVDLLKYSSGYSRWTILASSTFTVVS